MSKPNALRLPSLKALKVFEAAGTFGSFSVAAEKLCVTQSAVSRQIALLEEELGCRLFVREKKGVRLTDGGGDYHKSVSQALSEIARSTQELKLRNVGLNVIRLTTLPTLAMHWLLPKLPEFKACHPEIAVDVSSSNDLADLTTNTMHVGIRLGYGQWHGLVSEHLFDEELITVCSPKYLTLFKDGYKTALKTAPVLHTTTRPNAWKKWMEVHAVPFSDTEVVGFQDFYITIQAAILGQGVAVVPSFLVQEELNDMRLVDPTNLKVKSERSYYFVTSEENAEREPIVRLKSWIIRTGKGNPLN